MYSKECNVMVSRVFRVTIIDVAGNVSIALEVFFIVNKKRLVLSAKKKFAHVLQ